MLVTSCQSVFGGRYSVHLGRLTKNSICATSRKSSWGLALDRYDNAGYRMAAARISAPPTLGYDHVRVFGTVITRIATLTH